MRRTTRNKRKKRVKYKKRMQFLLFFIILCGITFYTFYLYSHSKLITEKATASSKQETVKVPAKAAKQEEPPKKAANTKAPESAVETDVLISSVGDCTIGRDDKFAYTYSLPATLEKHNNDYAYFFKNVAPIFQKDDITTANLETTFTEATAKAEKQYTFKAPPAYAKSLVLGSIDVVNLSNNHIYDYLQQGFTDTTKALDAQGVHYFGEGYKWISEVNGNKFGFLGYRGYYYDDQFLKTLKNDITKLKEAGCTVIINFHWGDEGSYSPNKTQKYIAHYAIDQGADLIIGHHPHVIEGMEQYKGKLICYSLGNFCFGGNTNPTDKNTFILQTKFHFKQQVLESYGVRIIPCSISSVDYVNDYCPTPLEGAKKAALLNKVNQLSFNLGFTIKDDFTYIDLAAK